MLGFNQDEVLGMDQHALFHYHRMDGSHYHVDECPIYKTTTDGDIRDVEDMFIRKDGTFFDVHLKITPIIVSDKIEGAVVVFQDITQTKALQKDIQEMNQNLKNMVAVETEKRVEQEKLLIRQSKMAMMGEMIGAIAHQWRQPLNALGLIVQDIRVAKEFDELDDGYINDFEKNAMPQIHFMSTTIDDFRNFFKPVKATTDFAIEDAVDKTLKIVNPQLKSHAIQTDFRYTSKHTVHGYQSELEQSIMIIISNAQDALIENNIEENQRK
jgi:PAS domain S-box-containing protein